MRYIYLILCSVLFTSVSAQSLQDVKICIDPGHGGYESDDRYISATGFWESSSNLDKAFYLRDMLTDLGATVVLTRIGNDGVTDDPSLSQRVAIANSYDVDFMHSIHSNGYNGERNSSLMLFQGFDNAATYPEAREMGAIMAPELYLAHRTTGYSNRGDFDFYGTGQVYLGIFRGLNMPGTLSEGSFHDYIPESWRLMNTDYRKHEAWAIMTSFRKYFKIGVAATGVIAGIVRDKSREVPYFYLNQADRWIPVNNIKITVKNQNLSYTGDALNNGFFIFDELSPGIYELIFDAPGYFRDSTTVNVVAGETVFADAYLTADGTILPVPEVPDHIRILVQDQNSVKILCDSVSFVENYIVYYGSDGVNFPDSVVSDNPYITIGGLPENQTVYLKLKARNLSGFSRFSKHVYAGAPASDTTDILVVDGFDRSTNVRYDYIRFYGSPVTAAGKGFSYALNETIIAGKVDLLQYQTVIWILGDESTADETFSISEQQLVANFLKNGGNLLVSGAEIGWDLSAKGNSTDKSFYQNYLKASYISDAPLNVSATYYSGEFIPGGLFDGLAEFDFDNGTHGTYDVDWPDAIKGLDGAQDILKFKNVAASSGVAGISFSGLFTGGIKAGKLIYLSIPFETIYPASARTEIMLHALMFFDDTQMHLDPDDNITDLIVLNFHLEQNYPNPFNPQTTIKFAIDNANYTTLKIYNTLGQLVRILIDKNLPAGNYEVNFNGSDLASGTYIYMLESGGRRIQKKMVFLR